jgi:N-acyl-D-amino-acid deacylase
VADIAIERRLPAAQAALDLIVSERNFVAALNHAIGDDDVAYVMRQPLTMVGSDAVGTGPDGRTGEDRVHPRCYGTFPRILGRYVREQGVVSEAEAIRKMTSLPSCRLGLEGRGRIAVGAFADVVVYDPSEVRDLATYADPHRTAEGIVAVIVNGRVVWESGAWTGALPGRVLRRPH